MTEKEKRKVKELKRFISSKKEIEQLKEEILYLEEQKTSIKSQIIKDMPKGGSERWELESILEDIENASKILNRKRRKLIKNLLKIENIIEKLEPTERTIMRCRYVSDMKWEDIGRKTNYVRESVIRIHKDIIKKIS